MIRRSQPWSLIERGTYVVDISIHGKVDTTTENCILNLSYRNSRGFIKVMIVDCNTLRHVRCLINANESVAQFKHVISK